jgi:hypothetical protein
MTAKAKAEIRHSVELDMQEERRVAMLAEKSKLRKEIERPIRPEIEKKVREELRERFETELEIMRAGERDKFGGKIRGLRKAYEECLQKES